MSKRPSAKRSRDECDQEFDLCHKHTSYAAELIATVKLMTAKGKGILAADEAEHEGLIPRFKSVGIADCSLAMRREYRVMLLGAKGLEEFIGGVIMHEETFNQRDEHGTPFPQALIARGILAGIKTDRGLTPFLCGNDGEMATEGLDGYLGRAKELYSAGARFCKWRAVYRIQNETVSDALIEHNANVQARYAILSQAAGLVPIVEPEVQIDGDHTMQQSAALSEKVWAAVVAKLHYYGVLWEGMVLKPNMCVPGLQSKQKVTPLEVAMTTVTALSRTIPPAVRCVAFLSGGLGEVESTQYLSAMVLQKEVAIPWNLRFSFARAVQNPALRAWAGKKGQIEAGRKALLHRVRLNSLASQGLYKSSLE